MAVISLEERRLREREMNPRSGPYAPWMHIDVLLVLAAAGLAAIGIAAIYSTTRGRDPENFDSFFLERQTLFAVAGALFMVFAAWFPYQELSKFAMAIYGAGLLALIVVLSPLGEEVNGARSWYRFGDFQLQPSEFQKLALIVAVAAFLSRYEDHMTAPRVFFAAGIVAWPGLLVLLQPDVGTALIYVFIGFVLLLIGGIRFRQVLGIALITVTVVALMVNSNMLEEYQTNRLRTFVDPTTGITEAGFQQRQAQIAIGNGGVSGKGYGEGSQTLSGLVPQQHTDFIFTVIGEEFGFVGSATTLGLYAILLLRILQAARLAKDRFGALICSGVFAMILFQMFEAVGMTLGITPITGIPLPLVSYGGSSAIATLIGLGLVLNVRMRRFT
ncbi:rod shape-determining protein RodA [Candidatus Poriferisocius sp.]|uniref:rod shape-determining protein RodA n=1 Tax=Candidatus Poriferisocius sp. TaxID=3101276 RepID=UPI003B5A3AD2